MFGRDPDLAFDSLLSGADVIAVTMLVLDRPSERASRFVRQHDRACSGGEIASVEGIPGWRSRCVLTKRQGSWHAS